MNYKECPHYDELLHLLSESRDFENISFQLNDIDNCRECSQRKEEVCNLWISLTLVDNLKPQMNISETELTIENLDTELKKIAFGLIKKSVKKNGDND